MTVSVWLFLLQQWAVGLCLLMSVGCAVRVPVRPFRLMALSLLGAACTALAVTSPLMVRLAALGGMMPLLALAAFPGMPRSLRLRMAMGMLCLTMGCAGMLRLWSPLPWIAALPLCCACLRSLPLMLPKPAALPVMTTLDVRCGPHRVTLTALIDSGNLLRDALTGLPVIVISRRAAMQLGQLPQGSTLPQGMRLMPVRTVNGDSLMALFRPDTVSLRDGNGWCGAECLIGISPDGHDGFQALVPACVLTCAGTYDADAPQAVSSNI